MLLIPYRQRVVQTAYGVVPAPIRRRKDAPPAAPSSRIPNASVRQTAPPAGPPVPTRLAHALTPGLVR